LTIRQHRTPLSGYSFPASGRGSPGSQIKPLRAATCREALPARRHIFATRRPRGLSVLAAGEGVQLGVARGDCPRSATGTHPGARPAYPVCERTAILDQEHRVREALVREHVVWEHLVRGRRIVIARMPCRPSHLAIIAAGAPAEKSGADDYGRCLTPEPVST